MHNRYIKYFLFLLLTTDLFLSVLFLKNGHTDTEKIFSLPVISKTAGTPKYIALTFDDDVIIGLSQEISYKEAVSMI